MRLQGVTDIIGKDAAAGIENGDSETGEVQDANYSGFDPQKSVDYYSLWNTV